MHLVYIESFLCKTEIWNKYQEIYTVGYKDSKHVFRRGITTELGLREASCACGSARWFWAAVSRVKYRSQMTKNGSSFTCNGPRGVSVNAEVGQYAQIFCHFVIWRLLLWIIRNFKQNQKYLQRNKSRLCSHLKWNAVHLFFSKVKIGIYYFNCLD